MEALSLKNRNQIEHFDGSSWAQNGPDVIARVILGLCPQADNRLPSKCEEFTILPRKNCYEISYPEWMKFFNADNLSEVKRRTNESYFIHLWNKMANNYKVNLDSHAPILDLAKELCPKVFHSRYDDFWIKILKFTLKST